jgi:hypothetical protein
MSRWIHVSLLAAAALCAVASAPPAAALSLRVESDAVVASEVTRGGNAVFFGVTYDATGFAPERAHAAAIVHDDDNDGVVRFAPPGGVPPKGIWGVVDFATGAVQLGSRPGYRVLAAEEPALRSLQKADVSERLDRFERNIGALELLVVRPGQGAWTISATEGGESDDDRAGNGNLVVNVENLRSLLPAGAAPVKLQAGDVVLLIDPNDMRAEAATIGAAQEGARR